MPFAKGRRATFVQVNTEGHLDCNLVLHCSQKCVSCSHASPFTTPFTMTTQMLARDLAAIKPFIHFKVLQMVGGEPTLHKNIVEMIRISKESGVGDSVSVITNGRHVQRMTPEFWDAIDWFQLSIYPTLPPENVEYAKQKCAEHNKPFYSTVFTEFHQQFRETPSDGSNFTHCHWKTNCFTLHDGHFYLCPQSAFFPKPFMGLEANVDGLCLDGLTEEKMKAFLNRKEPFNACRICAANEMKPKPWKEAKTKEEWIEQSILRT